MKNPVLLMVLLALTACQPPDPPAESAAPAVATEASGVVVHLFEWTWADVAEECEAVLGPAGFAAVQVSPPVEHALVEGRPWWERYQPVSYTITGRSGDRAAFADMVSRCQAVGVDIYVDAVLNHMTGVYEGVSTAGTTFGEYDYPGLYSFDDFHHCGLTENDDIEIWDDPAQVRTCELVNLADLRTSTEKVQATLAGYLNDLVSLGVAGFRVDAARHMDPADLSAILERVEGDPVIYQEVLDPDPPSWSADYYPMGRVTEFQYSYMVSDIFQEGTVARLLPGTEGAVWDAASFLPSEQAFVFIDNHDNQRGHGGGGGVVTYKDGRRHPLAMAFMLAYPYGQPRVMSSYAFEDDRQGPPTVDGEAIHRVYGPDGLGCSEPEAPEGWVCEHRQPMVEAMVGFHNAVDRAPLVETWTNGQDQLAFGRAARGFFLLNRSETEPLVQTLPTGLSAGVYCEVVSGGLSVDGQACVGPEVAIGADGRARFEVPPMSAAAFYIDAQVAP